MIHSRKFILAAFFAASSTVGLYCGYIDGNQYGVLVGLILGLYSGANVMNKRNTNVHESD